MSQSDDLLKTYLTLSDLVAEFPTPDPELAQPEPLLNPVEEEVKEMPIVVESPSKQEPPMFIDTMMASANGLSEIN